ncbi:hypothetical protein ACFX1Q_020824 [Malus domestica]
MKESPEPGCMPVSYDQVEWHKICLLAYVEILIPPHTICFSYRRIRRDVNLIGLACNQLAYSVNHTSYNTTLDTDRTMQKLTIPNENATTSSANFCPPICYFL